MVKNLPAMRDTQVQEDSPGEWQPTPVFLPGESHGQRSLESIVHGVTRVGHDIVSKPPPTATKELFSF